MERSKIQKAIDVLDAYKEIQCCIDDDEYNAIELLVSIAKQHLTPSPTTLPEGFPSVEEIENVIENKIIFNESCNNEWCDELAEDVHSLCLQAHNKIVGEKDKEIAKLKKDLEEVDLVWAKTQDEKEDYKLGASVEARMADEARRKCQRYEEVLQKIKNKAFNYRKYALAKAILEIVYNALNEK